eukprot:363560-Chlamydomonas_euryale.AAC.10
MHESVHMDVPSKSSEAPSPFPNAAQARGRDLIWRAIHGPVFQCASLAIGEKRLRLHPSAWVRRENDSWSWSTASVGLIFRTREARARRRGLAP